MLSSSEKSFGRDIFLFLYVTNYTDAAPRQERHPEFNVPYAEEICNNCLVKRKISYLNLSDF